MSKANRIERNLRETNEETKVGSVFYYLSRAEIRELRSVCKATRLPFAAMAARPEEARKLIREFAAAK